MARKKRDEVPEEPLPGEQLPAEPSRPLRAKKATAADATPVRKAAVAKKVPRKPADEPAPVPAEPPTAVLAAELEVLRAVLTGQQNELEQRRTLLDEVEFRERILKEELAMLRQGSEDVEDLRRELAEARRQAAEATTQAASAQAHANDVERRHQDMVIAAQEAEQALAGYQDEVADLNHELEQSQEWQNDLESELSLREALLQDLRESAGELHRELELSRHGKSQQAADLVRELEELRVIKTQQDAELVRRYRALEQLIGEHSDALLRLNQIDEENLELVQRLRVRELATRKLEKTLADRAEELNELATLVEEADAREDQLRVDYENRLRLAQDGLKEARQQLMEALKQLEDAPPVVEGANEKLAELTERAERSERDLAAAQEQLKRAFKQLETPVPSREILEGLAQAREQLQVLGERLAEADERAEHSDRELAAAQGLLDDLDEALEKNTPLDRIKARLKRLRGGSKMLDEIREKELSAERRAEEYQSDMVSMRARLLDVHNQLEASEMARQRAEQRVAALEEQMRTWPKR